MRDVISAAILLGVPGVVAGVLTGFLVRRGATVLLVTVLVVVAVLVSLRFVPDGPDDDDPGVLLAVAAVTNLAGFLLGVGAGRLLSRRR